MGGTEYNICSFVASFKRDKANAKWPKPPTVIHKMKSIICAQVLISTVTFIISTADELQEVWTCSNLKCPSSRICYNNGLLFYTSYVSVVLQDESGNVEFPWVVFVIELLDNFVVIFFTIEFAIRLFICPNKRRFLSLKGSSTKKFSIAQISYFG